MDSNNSSIILERKQKNIKTELIIQELLLKGTARLEDGLDITSMNRLLYYLNYEPVILHFKKLIILKDLGISEELNHPWNMANIAKAKAIVLKLANGGVVGEDDIIVTIMLEKNWIVRTVTGMIELSDRALIQFEDLILSQGSLYKKCELCNHLCKNSNFHPECKKLLNNQ